MTRQFILCILVILFASTTAFAQAPGMIPVQGTLVDATGAPLDGSYLFTLTLYDDAAGTNVVATEAQTVTVSGGYFTAFFGATGPIDPTTFRDNGDLYLGLAIDSDPEMQPLFTIGTSPWAGYSEYAGEADDAVLLGGLPASAYQLAADPIDFSLLTNVPAETDPVFGASPAAGISSSDIAAWGASETDPVFGASAAAGITTGDMAGWSASETDPVFGASAAAGISSSDVATWSVDADTLGGLICAQDEIARWDGSAWLCTPTAGLTTETDPVFGASAAAGISSSDVATWSVDADTLGGLICAQDEIARWDGFAWVCTPTAGLITETDPVFGASAAAGISSSDVATWSVDADTLGDLLCLQDEIARWDGSAWLCTPTVGLLTETDPAFGASPAAGITNTDIVSWNTPSDTLAGLSCSNGQVAQWNGSSWTCATVSGGGTETDPVWTAFQAAGGTIAGLVTSSGQSPGFAYAPAGANLSYVTQANSYSAGGSTHSDWILRWETPTSPGGLLMIWDGYENRLEVGGAGISTTGTISGNGSGLTNLNEADPVWTSFKGSGGTISGDLTLAGSAHPGVSFHPSTSTVGSPLSTNSYAMSGVDHTDLTIGQQDASGTAIVLRHSDDTDRWEFTGAVTSDCPQGTDEASGWCIENLGAGASSVPAAATWPTAVTNCHGKGMQLCPLAALMACDQLEPTTTGCEDATDGTGGTYDLWTADVQVPTGGGNAFSNLVTYGSDNNVDLEPESNSNNWLCCTAVYNP